MRWMSMKKITSTSSLHSKNAMMKPGDLTCLSLMRMETKNLSALYLLFKNICQQSPMAINKQRKIAILDGQNKMVYIGNVCVELNAYEVEKSFHVKDFVEKIRFSYFNGIKIIVLGCRAIYIYTENGELEREIKIPEEYGGGQSLAINHVTQRILIKTWRRL